MFLEQIREVSVEAVARPQIVFFATTDIVEKMGRVGLFQRDPNVKDRWVLFVDPRYDFDGVLRYMLGVGDWDPPTMSADEPQNFVAAFNEIQGKVHRNAVGNGWWDNPRSDGEVIALIHSELSECLEGLRSRNQPDKHLPEFNSATVELADAIIRIMDFAGYKNWPLADAIVAKIAYNTTRPKKHGKEF